MESLHAIIEHHWGYRTLRPLQHEAMTAAIDGRDSLVVLPTGGGKSLCYQAPALLAEGLTVVVSPMISLMKDQVDQLLARGIPAAFLNSSLDAADQRRVSAGLARNEYKLIFIAPERFANEGFYRLLGNARVKSFAIDEAHCISHWGHDFRGDYRQLGELKKRFPTASVHAFTATATPRVRKDIVAQLGLHDPAVLVGDFFRPNLIYRAVQRSGVFDDVMDSVQERRGKPGIVYCIRRVDVDDLTLMLKSAGIRAIGYHAGMSDDSRTQAQDAFAAGQVDVVVATVAFGMGIDRADIRYVIHAAMPKSIEHYQQETGRAGRDGQPAECILFYSGSDFHTWQNILDKNESPYLDEQIRLLSEMYNFCTGATCRHRRLVNYFGQTWDRGPCNACDVCTGGLSALPDSTLFAQKIMSCVVRTGERFGAGHVADVLLGNATDKVIDRGHDKLSTFRLMSEQSKPRLMRWIDQLVDQELLLRDGDYRVLKVTPNGWQVLRSKAEAVLYDPTTGERKERRRRKVKSDSVGAKAGPEANAFVEHLDHAGQALFEKLRMLRRQIAEENNVPVFMVFADRTLREIARVRPRTRADFLRVKGVGPAKYESYGRLFLDTIKSVSEGTSGD